MNALELLNNAAFAPWLGNNPNSANLSERRVFYLNEEDVPNSFSQIYAAVSVLEGGPLLTGNNVQAATKLVIYELCDPRHRDRYQKLSKVDSTDLINFWNELKKRQYHRLIDEDISGERLHITSADLVSASEPALDRSTGIIAAQLRLRLSLWR